MNSKKDVYSCSIEVYYRKNTILLCRSFNPDFAIGAIARVAASFFRPQQVSIAKSGFAPERYIKNLMSVLENDTNKIIVGWREWISLPDLGIKSIKAKMDTGAKTAALHTYFIEPVNNSEKPMVRFGIHPMQKSDKNGIICTADIFDERRIVDSGGHPELRYIIRTSILVGNKKWLIDLSLTNREQMRFRLLLGRTTISEQLIIDPKLSFTLGRPIKAKRNKKIY